MPQLPFFTADVFTKVRFGGNPLAVVFGGQAIDVATMQAIAAEFNLSETTFVLPPADPANTARVRIFNRSAEMAFAGHPLVGTAFVLANQRPDLNAATFEVPAGIVHVQIERDADGVVVAAAIETPQPLTIGDTVAHEVIAQALRLAPADVVTTHHLPVAASNGNAFVIAEVTREALSRCDPDLAAFRAALAAHPQFGSRFAIHVYSREGQVLRARMFAPLSGTWEDPATGSANTPLACLLLSLEPEAQEAGFEIHQGVEMGRPSLLHVDARRTSDGIVATLRGACVAVMQGEIAL
ncbi:trans-2,3-dihydro-3-hydroxyanthranilate isomerase [Novosphingobium sp. PhB165]|uniref:PhzF family phenazine biosynthesis protein n=1 Tax=Novosphingobium sp. PhB165 TaxID=2485105 RepID=UPI001048EF16|nr:PhzF family phenazine biosynthesis protein [Novosphingobium sp. PhB165]TCM20806.1 trans-2,3-dihydro-3-hydroxyanthranilate isomerase [Novosphingobium sp. PhB165]